MSLAPTNQPTGLSLIPLLLFVATFLGTGVYLHLQGVEYAFYQLPAPVAIIPAVILAIVLDRRLGQSSQLPAKPSFNESITTFIPGMGHMTATTICLFYLSEGDFSSLAKATGGVDGVGL